MTRAQAATCGLDSRAVTHRVDRGELQPLGRRVLRIVGSPDTPVQRARAATLDADGVLSHESAAAWWGLPGFRLEPLHVSVVRRANPIHTPLASIHRIRALGPPYTTVLRDVPVVRPELLMLHLCGSVHPARAERAFERAWSKRILSGPSTRRVLDEVAASGVRGVLVLRGLLDARPPDYVPAASGLELRFVQIIAESGLPAMARQVDLGDDEHWCGRVDFVDRDLRLVVEVDSEEHHAALLDQQHDAARQERLEAAGFVVVRVWDSQVWHRPWEVAAAVRAGREEALQSRRRVRRL